MRCLVGMASPAAACASVLFNTAGKNPQGAELRSVFELLNLYLISVEIANKKFMFSGPMVTTGLDGTCKGPEMTIRIKQFESNIVSFTKYRIILNSVLLFLLTI